MPILLRTPEPAPSFVGALCPGCSAPVALSSGDGGWLLDGQLWHPACAPWQGRPFPLAWAGEEGRRVIRRLRRDGRPVSPNLSRAVAYLEAAERAWPPPDPAAVLRRGGDAIRVIGHWRERARDGAATR